MDGETLGAAIAICGKQIDEKMESLAGELDLLIVSIENNRLVFREKEGE